AGAGQRAAERVEVETLSGAGRTGRRIAPRAAEPLDRGAEAVDQHVRRGNMEVVLAVLRVELPCPGVAHVAGQRACEAARRALVGALDRRAAGADQPTDELHVRAVRVVGMRD